MDQQEKEIQNQQEVIQVNLVIPTIQQVQKLEEFYVDTINRVLYGTPTAFLDKYPTIDHYQQIIQAQQLVESLCYEIVKKNARTKQQLQTVFIEGKTPIPQQIFKPLYKAVKYKILDIFKQIVKRQMRIGSAHLLAYDWKILNVFSNSQNTKKNRVLIKLMLILSRDGQQNTVHLEMTSQELNNFLNSLKQIKKRLKG